MCTEYQKMLNDFVHKGYVVKCYELKNTNFGLSKF